MSPTAGTLLLNAIRPLIMAAIGRGAARPIGAEDPEELAQDTLATAAKMLESCEVRRQELKPHSIAFYAIQATRSGRRSTSASRTDVMGAGAQLDGRCTMESLNTPVSDEQDGVELPLGEMLADGRDDSATLAGRNLDWNNFLADSDDRTADILHDVAVGNSGLETAERLGVSTPRVVQIKRQIGKRLVESWGSDPDTVLADATTAPAWQKHVDCFREQRTCRHERARTKTVTL